jgi:hypothetical protein
MGGEKCTLCSYFIAFQVELLGLAGNNCTTYSNLENQLDFGLINCSNYIYLNEQQKDVEIRNTARTTTPASDHSNDHPTGHSTQTRSKRTLKRHPNVSLNVSSNRLSSRRSRAIDAEAPRFARAAR